jgi:hypothetical protein
MRRSADVPLGRAYLAVASLAASAGLTAACGNGDEERVYCADENGVVVDDDNCDDDRVGRVPYFLWVGPFARRLRPGAKLSGGQRFAPSDTAARSRLGLSTSGPVTNGTAISGGFGSGKSGSGGG